MLNTAYESDSRPPAPVKSTIAAHSDTAIYFGAPNVDATYAHLRAQGLEVDPPVVTHYGYKHVTLKDPDGFNLCFHWPREIVWST